MYIYSKRFAVVTLLLTLVLLVYTGFQILALGFTAIKKGARVNIDKLTHIYSITDRINIDKQLPFSSYSYSSLNLSSIKLRKVAEFATVSNIYESYDLPANKINEVKVHNRQVYDIATVKSNNSTKLQPTLNKKVVLQRNSRQAVLKSPANYTHNSQFLADNYKATTASQNPVSSYQNNINLSTPIKFTANAQKMGGKFSRSRQLPTVTSSPTTTKRTVTIPFNSISYEGNQVTFIYQQGKWLAYIKQCLGIGYRDLILPVYGEFGFSIEKLLNSTSDWQKEHIHVYSSNAYPNGNRINYLYIGKLKTLDYGIKIDVEKNIDNLVAAYYLINPSIYFHTDKLQVWKAMLVEIGNILARIKINLTVFSINPNPEKVKTALEQVVYSFLHRRVRLENYSMVYNKMLTQINKQLQLIYKDAIYRSSNFYENYTVALQVGLQNIYPLLIEFNKVKLAPKDKVASFDLNKLFEALEINVSVKKVPKSSAESLPTNIEYFLHTQAQEEIQLAVLSSVSSQSSYAQTFVDNTINSYPTLVEKSGEALSTDNLYLEEYDLPTSMHIPRLIHLSSGDAVTVTFGSSLKKPENVIISADRLVDQRLIPSLIQALNKANETVKIESIHISATTNGHDGKQYANSNHRKENGARAIDISRINGRNIADLGGNNPLVIALQNALDEIPLVRENFGPYLRHKNKKPYTTSRLRENHKNHIHFSINR